MVAGVSLVMCIQLPVYFRLDEDYKLINHRQTFAYSKQKS